MDDALGVRGLEAVGDLNADLQEFGYLDGLLSDAAFESLALEEFHGDKRPPFEASDIVNGADIRVIERRRSARFAAESLDRLRVLRNVVGEKFQGDASAQPGVLGLVDHSHSAAAQLFQDAIVRNGAAYNRSSVRHLGMQFTPAPQRRQTHDIHVRPSSKLTHLADFHFVDRPVGGTTA